MSFEKRPGKMIRDLFAERASWSDAEVLAEIEHLPPLADEDDPVWNKQSYWREFAYRYVALSDVAAHRKLRPAVRLLLQRACNGDPGEMMRGLRHSFERIFNPDWAALADVCMDLCRSKRAGTRLWAIHQLMILDDPRARQVFDHALNDEAKEVRGLAAAGLDRTPPSLTAALRQMDAQKSTMKKAQSKSNDTRYLDIHEHDELDEAQLAAWVKQASQLPGQRM